MYVNNTPTLTPTLSLSEGEGAIPERTGLGYFPRLASGIHLIVERPSTAYVGDGNGFHSLS